jgi:hypothetical protein
MLPIWDVVEPWLKSRPSGRVAARCVAAPAPAPAGVDGDPGIEVP